jgi:hypothetical protein
MGLACEPERVVDQRNLGAGSIGPHALHKMAGTRGLRIE